MKGSIKSLSVFFCLCLSCTLAAKPLNAQNPVRYGDWATQAIKGPEGRLYEASTKGILDNLEEAVLSVHRSGENCGLLYLRFFFAYNNPAQYNVDAMELTANLTIDDGDLHTVVYEYHSRIGDRLVQLVIAQPPKHDEFFQELKFGEKMRAVVFINGGMEGVSFSLDGSFDAIEKTRSLCINAQASKVGR